ncbi:MAG: Hsp20/alpha crystallin family protein, partial [Anaerolineales bacterium]
MARIVRYNPAHTAWDRFFDDLWRSIPQTSEGDDAPRYVTPAMDIIDGENEVEVQLDLPGFGSDDVNIEFEKGILTISAERTTEQVDEDAQYTRRERYRGAFRR